MSDEAGAIASSAQTADSATSSQVELLSVAGIRCAACVQLIEYRVSQLKGMESFRINPVSQKAQLRWDANVLTLKQIIQSIVDLGYAAFPANQSLTDYQAKEKKTALWRLFVAGFAMMQVMMYAFPAYLVPVPEVGGDLSPDLDRLLKLASLIITLPVVGFSALPFFRGAVRDLRHRFIGMDVPVSLGILLTFFASSWNTFYGGAVYFDSAIMFVFLLLGARFIESNVKRRTSAALSVLTQIHPVKAYRFPEFPRRDTRQDCRADEVKVGDFLFVPAGEQVPCDGIVVEGESQCDEALMTGESHPVSKKHGDRLIGGSVNVHSPLVMRAESVGSQTQLANLIAMMESASMAKPKLVAIADKHASHFLLAIILIAIISALVWTTIDSSRAFWIGISVIVVTCPCALSLATPGVMSATIGQLAKFGLLVTRGDAVENLANVTHVVFDKTGTLTFGKLKVLDAVFLAPNSSHANAIAGLMSGLSSHPIAKAIHEDCVARQLVELEKHSNDNKFNIIRSDDRPGAGVEATIGELTYRLGSLSFVQEMHLVDWAIPFKYSDKTVSVLADQHRVLAYFVMEDKLRLEAASAVAELHADGKQVVLLSGDRPDVVQEVAAECGIRMFKSEMSPSDKYEFIVELQRQGAVVAMVGDGMNDGPALSIANVSVAMGQGAPISQTRSDCLLMSNRLSDFCFGLQMATKAYRLIKQNLAWALLYNLIAIPAAVLGLLEPWHAALGMSLSSLLVVVNGLRLLSMRPIDYDLPLAR
ncbi:heavy metal translocating P-type ATPase [Undibacterium fentianense]|uniref:Cation-translocating P-type ATPase n=1 Tax=Undibacterium fentianense TaxID=2828728 RepID=A0A941E569_9BURK|nr:cation-translocating P-type ATPase [Undibacterium fentianense]MBR7798983.1 cation-translocating P-type ATPase [Undibacterium fentianense]